MQSDYSLKNKLEEIYGVKVQNEELFKTALTHTSYTHELSLSTLYSYERLEFLGDAVLKLLISDILYKKFPDYPEGELSKIRSIIVSDATLAKVAREIGLDKLILIGKQERKSSKNIKDSICACAFEAVLGAFFLTGQGVNMNGPFDRLFSKHIEEVDKHFENFNAKAVLQEYTQGKNKKLPEYTIVEEKGPEHEKIFVMEVSYMGEVLAKGKGHTKRAAEQECAYEACKKLGVVK